MEDSWENTQTMLTFDVVDEDVVATEFMGRAELPLAELINDSTLREQEVVRRWLPLTFRFDGSKADENLLHKAAAAKAKPATPPRRQRPHSHKPRSPSSFFHTIHHAIFRRRRPNPEPIRPKTPFPAYTTSDNGRQTEHPFGRILIQAQLVLPEAGAE